MIDDDKFFELLRADARPLRHEPDALTLARIRARIREHIEKPPTVRELLAAWLRPLAAALTVLAIAGAIGAGSLATGDDLFLGDAIEISMAGGTYRVAN